MNQPVAIAAESRLSSTRRWIVVATMVFIGSWMMNGSGKESGTQITENANLVAVGTLIVLATGFVVRRIRWWLLIYLPTIYVLSIGFSDSLLFPKIESAIFNSTSERECERAAVYFDEMFANDKLNSYIRTFSVTKANDKADWHEQIDSLNHEIDLLKSAEVPKMAVDLHGQRILLYEGWRHIFETAQRGDFIPQMLVDLQKVDDRFEELQFDLAVSCGEQSPSVSGTQTPTAESTDNRPIAPDKQQPQHYR